MSDSRNLLGTDVSSSSSLCLGVVEDLLSPGGIILSSSDETKRRSSSSLADAPFEISAVFGVKEGGALTGALFVKKLEMDCCFLAEPCERFWMDTIIYTRHSPESPSHLSPHVASIE